MTKVIIVGAGGHARVMVSLLGYLPQIEIVGVADRDDSSLGEEIGVTRVITTWEALPEWHSRGVEGIVLALGNNELRRRMFHAVQAMGFRVLGLRHPTALVEPGAVIGQGVRPDIARVLERYGDISSPATLDRAADEAIHNAARARFVATELRALDKAQTPARVIAQAAKAFAEATIARKKVREIKPYQHTLAEARAAKAAQGMAAMAKIAGPSWTCIR